jgi:holo-[acyl-carrier protein] synthase
MICGIGTDLTDIKRIKKLLKGDRKDAFMRRVLTTKEMELAELHENRLQEYVAGRFAVKEAVSKALGCGIGGKLSFQDIEVVSDTLGKPVCHISDCTWIKLGYAHPIRMRVHVTITHVEDYANAMAVVEQM